MSKDFSESKISVIIPVHNTGKYLKKCLDALSHQTYNNMEIIIIDDASTEDIKSIVDLYDNIIFFRSEINLKPGGARNLGISLATGKYISFCDSDDWPDLNLYSKCVETMDKTDAEIGMYTLVRSYDCPIDPPIYKCKYDEEIIINGEIAFRIVTGEYDMGVKVIPPVTNRIIKKSFLDSFNIKFKENLYYEDLLFTTETLLSAKKVVCIPNVKYNHYKRPGSIVQSIEKQHINDFFEVFSLIEDYLNCNELWNQYRFNFFKFLERYHNLIIRQIFEYKINESEKKELLSYSFLRFKNSVCFDDYFEFKSAEEIRQHIQPHIKDTSIY